jgi:Tol biopolymer transport system component
VDKVAHDWHPDGRTVLFTINMPPRGQRNFWLLTTDGNKKPEPWFSSDSQHQDGHFSPNGRHVAYVSDESGSSEVSIV